MQMANADRFISIFNEVEHHLRTFLNTRPGNPFYSLVDDASKLSPVVKTYSRDLKNMANLRNAILHHRDYPKIVIADPREETVIEFDRIKNEIKNPQTIMSIAAKSPDVFSPDTALSDALKSMRTKDFSQILVREADGKHSLLTREGVAMWVEANIADDIVSISETTIKEVLPLEDCSRWEFASREATIYDAQESFSNPKQRIQAIIISHNGRATEKPLGIVTIWDFRHAM